jgi:hypothetical protein
MPAKKKEKDKIEISNVTISTRVSTELMGHIKKEITLTGFYVNEADFFRNAVRNELVRVKVFRIRKEFLDNKNSVKSVRELRKAFAFIPDEHHGYWIEEATREMPRNAKPR